MRHDDTLRKRVEDDVARIGVDAACALHGVHRSTWYRWAARKATTGGGNAPVDIAPRLREIALEHPAWGCDRIAYFLSFEGVRLSSPTIQKTLIALGLGRRADRIRASLGSATDRRTPPERPPS